MAAGTHNFYMGMQNAVACPRGGSGGWSTPLSSDRTTVHYMHDANMVTPQHPLATLSHKPWPYISFKSSYKLTKTELQSPSL